MKLTGLTVRQLAAVVCDRLERHGFTAVLTGGACVMIYARGKYVSQDLDFVVTPRGPLKRIETALAELGFRPQGRVYVHPDTDMVVDVGNPWPPAVGQEVLEVPAPRRVAGHQLRLLSPTDCVKDRLVAFYHWNDRQALEQAILVCLARKVDMRGVGRWSRNEGMEPKYRQFRRELTRRRRATRRT
jgi:hypothetical protein